MIKATQEKIAAQDGKRELKEILRANIEDIEKIQKENKENRK